MQKTKNILERHWLPFAQAEKTIIKHEGEEEEEEEGEDEGEEEG